MRLIDNAKQVLLKAWSVRWILIANALGAAPALVDGLDDYVSPHTTMKLMLLTNIAALVSRFIKQDSVSGPGDGKA
jgi:hypothetical protein